MKSTGKCSCCRTDDIEVQSFDLPVFGSEGVRLCQKSINATCDFINERTMEFLRDKRDEVIARNKRIERAVLEGWSRS